MLQLTVKDFRNLQFNVYELKQGKDVLTAFPELANYPEFRLPFLDDKGKDDPTQEYLRNPIIRYALLLYQKHTPLLREKDLNVRKTQALQLAGFPSTEGKYTDAVIDIKESRNIVANRIIDRICRLQKDLLYSTWQTMMENYHNTLAIIRDNTVFNKKDGEMKETKTRQELANNLPEQMDKIEAIAKKLFNDDIAFMYEADEINESIHKKLSPEDIAYNGLPPEPENPFSESSQFGTVGGGETATEIIK